ncbi:MAG: RNA-binding S4 domain-containing protein [Bacteroidales bacterium]|nr:RNA-binding S4 domain-containing protein [Bacteroidales bacterium]MBN2819796.1 RNA-binding S4 domain-containing protein [Bacteroidales bacterium]
MIQFELNEEYIELYKLLKALNLVATGGHGKLEIENGEVNLNGSVEYRKRAKIRRGDRVEYFGQIIDIV